MNAGLGLVIASLALILFLRRLGRTWPAATLGTLTALWLAGNLGLAASADTNRLVVLIGACLLLLTVDTLAHRRSIKAAALVGAAIGVILLGDMGLGLSFLLFLGPWAVFRVSPADNVEGRPLIALGITAIIAAGLIVAPRLIPGQSGTIDPPNGGPTSESRRSAEVVAVRHLPPAEAADLIAPGYWGWATLDPDGPYRGRIGRTSNWDINGGGVENDRFGTFYIGLIPIVLAAVAAVGVWRRRSGSNTSVDRDARYWSFAAAASFLLSIGLLGGLLSHSDPSGTTPIFDGPIGFLHVFQLAVGILAALGLDLAVQMNRKALISAMALIWLLSAAALMGYRLTKPSITPATEAVRVFGTKPSARATTSAGFTAVEHAAFVAWLAAVWASCGLGSRPWGGRLATAAVIPVLIVAADVALLSHSLARTRHQLSATAGAHPRLDRHSLFLRPATPKTTTANASDTTTTARDTALRGIFGR